MRKTPTSQAAVEYASNGKFVGETDEQAALHWANWCERRDNIMLAQFLRQAAKQLKKPIISDVYMICDAYESGIGHGLKKDGHDDRQGDLFSNPLHGEAYRIGYKRGHDKTPAVAYAIKDHEIAQAVNELRDIAVQYHGAEQLRERIAQVIIDLVRKTKD